MLLLVVCPGKVWRCLKAISCICTAKMYFNTWLKAETAMVMALRNHDYSIAYGFCSMNCTNREKNGFYGIATANTTKAYSRERTTVRGHDSMQDTLNHVMRGSTNLCDAVCLVLGIPTQFDQVSRTKRFAGTIIDGNRIEQITVGLSKMDTPACEDLVCDAIEPNPVKPKRRRQKNVKVGVNELSKPPIIEGGLACHTDPQNARRRGYRGNISFVKCFHTSKS